jgi:uncharacterized membrane protein YfcA
MSPSLILVGAGFAAGAMNALAGGGSFVTLPALIGTGVPSVTANVSSTIALYPGGIASALVYRRGEAAPEFAPLPWLVGITLAGGLAGAALLLATPTRMFDEALPWLMLVATLALAGGRRLGERLRGGRVLPPAAMLGAQALLGLYCGYFGGAVGIMMMAFWSLAAGAEPAQIQGLRTLLVSVGNTAAVAFFLVAGGADWRAVLLLAPAALAGGWTGAWAGRRLPARVVRGASVLLAAAVTADFFARSYG